MSRPSPPPAREPRGPAGATRRLLDRVIDAGVERWHKSATDDPTPIHTWLGMTSAEYAAWAEGRLLMEETPDLAITSLNGKKVRGTALQNGRFVEIAIDDPEAAVVALIELTNSEAWELRRWLEGILG